MNVIVSARLQAVFGTERDELSRAVLFVDKEKRCRQNDSEQEDGQSQQLPSSRPPDLLCGGINAIWGSHLHTAAFPPQGPGSTQGSWERRADFQRDTRCNAGRQRPKGK